MKKILIGLTMTSVLAMVALTSTAALATINDSGGGTLQNGLVARHLSSARSIGRANPSDSSETPALNINGSALQGNINSSALQGTVNAAAPPSIAPTTPLTLSTASAVRYDFEDGTLQGWFRTWGGSDWILTNSTDQAFTGSHALSLSVPSHAYPAIENVTGPFTGLIGNTFTIQFWAPSGDTNLTAQVFVVGVTPSGKWNYAWGTKTPLKNGWQSLSVAVPSTFTQIKMIGFQAGEHGHWTGEMYFDSVSW